MFKHFLKETVSKTWAHMVENEMRLKELECGKIDRTAMGTELGHHPWAFVQTVVN